MKLVLFVDALDPEDVEKYCPEMAEDMVGKYDVGVPRVTPNVVSQVMTGLPPEEMQLLRSTPFFEPSEEGGWEMNEEGEPEKAEEGPHRGLNGDPKTGARRVGIHDHENILERLDNEGVKVFQFGVPFCSFVDLENGMSVYDELSNEQLPAFMQFVDPEYTFREDDWSLIGDVMASDTVLKMESVEQLAREGDVDVVFLGFKHIDHCTHWHFPEAKEGLIQLLWDYIQELRRMDHEVMWWSDHGSKRKEATFRINKYLKEKGHLSYKVDMGFVEKARMYGETPQFKEQISLGDGGVRIDWSETVAYCSDAFDSQVDVHPDASGEEIEEVVKDLRKHPAVENAWRKEERFDQEAENYWFMPEIIVKRASGVVVTNNIHPDVQVYRERPSDESWQEFPEDNMGMRPGVHSQYGCFGGDIDASHRVEDGKPHQVHDIILDFVNPSEYEEDSQREEVEQEVKDKLEELGYV